MSDIIDLEKKMRLYHNNSQSSWFKKYIHIREKFYIYRNPGEITDLQKDLLELLQSIDLINNFIGK